MTKNEELTLRHKAQVSDDPYIAVKTSDILWLLDSVDELESDNEYLSNEVFELEGQLNK